MTDTRPPIPTDPTELRDRLEAFRVEWEADEAKRSQLIAERRALVLAAIGLDPPLTKSAIAELLGVSQPFITKLCRPTEDPGDPT